jgi:hypothetical protein
MLARRVCVCVCVSGQEQGRAGLGERHRPFPDAVLVQDPRGVREPEAVSLRKRASHAAVGPELLVVRHIALNRRVRVPRIELVHTWGSYNRIAYAKWIVQVSSTVKQP